tara:strand:+ start:89 stop:607 length:519 start_codon:yes stop_codon:yes gene_type:complete
MTPIVEPEVLMDGNHTLADAYETTDWVLREVFYALKTNRAALGGMILKVNMVMPGYDAEEQADVDTVAGNTIVALRRNVPVAVPGVAFLSGGQSDERAVDHLKVMNKMMGENPPWKLSFSYGRALQGHALQAFSPTCSPAEVQGRLLERTEACHQACKAKHPSLAETMNSLD